MSELYYFPSLFSKEECEELVALAEKVKKERFEEGTYHPKIGRWRIKWEDEKWQKLAEEKLLGTGMDLPVESCLFMILLIYDEAHSMACEVHRDYSWSKEDQWSLCLYGNTVEEGGVTSFYDKWRELELSTKSIQGDAVLFSVYKQHSATAPKGKKYFIQFRFKPKVFIKNYNPTIRTI